MARSETILKDWYSDPGRWWKVDPEFDRYLITTYGTDLLAAKAGQYGDWPQTPRGRLALIILLDQFSRNIHRDTVQMYDGDALALELSLEAIDGGIDQTFESDEERLFLYMPLMHSEDRAVQSRSLKIYKALPKYEQFAISHADIVERFGRFPHRNIRLGRTSTTEEIEFLKQPGSSF